MIRTNTVENYSQNTPWPSKNPRENTAICNVNAQMLYIRENSIFSAVIDFNNYKFVQTAKFILTF